MEIVIGRCHGGWAPEDGFVKIPSGVNLFLFQEPRALMDAWDADVASMLPHEWLQKLQSRAVLPLISGDVVPDYRTEPLASDDVDYFTSNPDPEVAVVPGDGMYLSEVLAQSQGNVYWFACQAFMKEPDPDAYKNAVAEGKVKLA